MNCSINNRFRILPWFIDPLIFIRILKKQSLYIEYKVCCLGLGINGTHYLLVCGICETIFPDAFSYEQPFPFSCYFMYVSYKPLVIFSRLSSNGVHAEVQMHRDYKFHSAAVCANSII